MNVDELAERQYGIVTRVQAAQQLSQSSIDRRLAVRRWIPVFPGVYRVSGAPQTSSQRMFAASAWSGGFISHMSAACVLRIDGVSAPLWTDVTVDRKTGLSTRDVVVHRAMLPRTDCVVVDGIPCTSATRTLLDCAPLMTLEGLETAFEQARRLGLTSVGAVQTRLRRGRPGAAAMREVIAHAQDRPKESRLEVKLARLLRTSGLPLPVAQFHIGAYRVDYAWSAHRLVCECDGFACHGDQIQWRRDRRRVAAIEAAGWRVVHVTWDDVTRRPAETVGRLAGALRDAAA